MAQAVFNHLARAGAAEQGAVVEQLNAFLPVVFHIGEAHHMGGRFTFRVLAFEFRALVDTFEPGLCDLFGFLRLHMALEPNKVFVFVG